MPTEHACQGVRTGAHQISPREQPGKVGQRGITRGNRLGRFFLSFLRWRPTPFQGHTHTELLTLPRCKYFPLLAASIIACAAALTYQASHSLSAAEHGSVFPFFFPSFSSLPPSSSFLHFPLSGSGSGAGCGERDCHLQHDHVRVPGDLRAGVSLSAGAGRTSSHSGGVRESGMGVHL